MKPEAITTPLNSRKRMANLEVNKLAVLGLQPSIRENYPRFAKEVLESLKHGMVLQG